MTRRSSSARIAWSTAQPECRCGNRYDIFSASPRLAAGCPLLLPSLCAWFVRKFVESTDGGWVGLVWAWA
jgi:hypothetical protein